MPSESEEKGNGCEPCMVKDVSKENAQQIAVDFMKKRKNTEKIDVAVIEQNRNDWIIRGTCPIDMEGHPWAEKFEVVVDPKGKIKDTRSALL
jgi:hypothetical protein